MPPTLNGCSSPQRHQQQPTHLATLKFHCHAQTQTLPTPCPNALILLDVSRPFGKWVLLLCTIQFVYYLVIIVFIAFQQSVINRSSRSTKTPEIYIRPSDGYIKPDLNVDVVRDSGTSSCISRFFDDVEYVFISRVFLNGFSAHLCALCALISHSSDLVFEVLPSALPKDTCSFQTRVKLDTNLECHQRECAVSTVRVVEVMPGTYPSALNMIQLVYTFLSHFHSWMPNILYRRVLWVHSSDLCALPLLQRRSESICRVSWKRSLILYFVIFAFSWSNLFYTPAQTTLLCVLTSK